MGKLLFIIQMVSKCNSTCPYDREGGERERDRDLIVEEKLLIL